jgi:hypothetical protein
VNDAHCDCTYGTNLIRECGSMDFVRVGEGHELSFLASVFSLGATHVNNKGGHSYSKVIKIGTC